MSSGGGTPPPPPIESAATKEAREARWRGQGYADITKLREISARHEHQASKHHQRGARFQTKVDKLRHQATVYREKAQKVLGRVPDLEAQMGQYERDIHVIRQRTQGATIGTDATDLQYKVRKIQQKIVDLQHKARTYELKAAQRTQKSAELKVRADQEMEKARQEEQEAASYRQRADRLQAFSEAEMANGAASTGAHPVGGPPPGDTL